MFRSLSFVVLGLCFGLLQGCAAPPMNFSVENVEPVHQKVEAELKSVNVMWGKSDELVGSVPSDWNTDITQAWTTALTDAVDRAAIFQDDASKKMTLSVRILELDPPGMGITMVTDTTARYDLIDRSTGKTVRSEVIKSKGEVPMGYSFYGYKRAVESINRSVQKNIEKFLFVFE